MTRHELRHGYSLDDLQRAARKATVAAGMTSQDMRDRYEIALSAIAEHLYAAEHPPREHRLVDAGRDAIWEEAKATLRHCGYVAPDDRRHAGSGTSPRFAAYWLEVATPHSGLEDRVVERVAAAQILPMLTGQQRAAIGALTAHDDYRLAADSLGLQYKTYAGYVADGRRRFLRWWHQGEAPSKQWMADHRNGGDEARSGRRSMKRLRMRTGTRVNRDPSPDLLPVDEGARLGSLTVLEQRRRGAVKILCRCDCGTERPFLIANLRRGNTQSCGCPQGRAAATERNRANGSVEPGGGAYRRLRSSARAADRRALAKTA